jgi:UDP-N-acetylglucosamine 2-epimerase (non-hydrolysing)
MLKLIKMNITIIAGARPNFMKIAPIIHAIIKAKNEGKEITYRLVHTGQHYDAKMSDTFFEELNIPQPDVNLECGGGTQAEQTANIMVAFEKDLIANPSDMVMVVGDVTSTMACSIVAKKMNIKVSHIEAGIRSGDITMPEEINRIVTDSLTDYFFTTTIWAGENLRKQGVSNKQIFFVGNVMIDTLLANINRFKAPKLWEQMKLSPSKYIVMTMHRPANVDEESNLKAIMMAISESVGELPVIFPIHPRTRQIFENTGINAQNIHPIDPLGYLEFNYLVKYSKAVITDSGGITEETTVMGVPCITLRNNTERPETVELGTNVLIGTNPNAIKPAIEILNSGNWKRGKVPQLWDGKSAERIINQLLKL